MAIVSVSGLPGSSGKKNQIRDSIENLLTDLALGDHSNLRQYTALYAKLSVTDTQVQAGDVLDLNDFAISAGRKIAVSVALVKTIEGSLEDVAALYATRKTVAGLGNEAVRLSDSDLVTTELRALDKRTSGVIDVAALETLTGSLVDMTAALKSNGIAGLANATLLLDQDAPLTAKNLKAVTTLATQAAKLENVTVDVSGAMELLEGNLTDVVKLLAAEAITGLDGIDVSLTNTKLAADALAELVELTDAAISAGKLKTLTGDAASVAALYEANVEGLDSVKITLSDAALDAADLNALLAATAGKITASKLKTLSGSLEDIVEALTTPKTQIASLTNKALTLTDSELDASQLIALNALSKGRIDAGSLTLLTGSAADIRTLLATPVKQVSGLGSQDVNVEDGASVADLNAIDAATSGVISASISGSAATLVSLNTGSNDYIISITDAASLEQLTRIAASTSQDLDYSALHDSATALVGDGSEPSEWLVEGVDVTIIGTATPAQLLAITAIIGGGTLAYSGFVGPIADGMDFSTNYLGTVGVLLTGSDDDQAVTGSVYDDVIFGGAGNDILHGNDGDDTLYGGAGVDVLSGGAGDDTLYGADSEAPDGESNAFVYLPFFGQGNDTIIGFQPGKDRIILPGAAVANVQITKDGADAFITLTHHNLQITTIRLVDRAGQITPKDLYIVGSAVADVLYGNDGDNLLSGMEGNDTLYGGAGSDTLVGGLGDDILHGGGSHAASGGRDVFLYEYGFGQGNDTVVDFKPGQDKIALLGRAMDIQIDTDGTDALITLTHGNQEVTTIRLSGLAGQITQADFIITGSDADDSLYGDDDSNTLVGLGGDDILYGGAGVDRLFGGAGDDIFVATHNAIGVCYDGGGGHDTLRVTGLSIDLTDDTLVDLESIEIADGASAIVTVAQAHLVSLVGNGSYSIVDSLWGVYEGRRALGEALYPTLSGAQSFTIYGTERGSWFDNFPTWPEEIYLLLTVFGQGGGDYLTGGVMYGGPGDDSYIFQRPTDQIIEAANEGHDSVISRLDYTLGANVEDLTLSDPAQTGIGNDLNNVIKGNDNDNDLYGMGGDDTLFGDMFGTTSDDRLHGGIGNDYLDGGKGNDTLFGDEGQDTLYGGLGADALHGGAGLDEFVYFSAADSTLWSRDSIHDFEAGETIDLSALQLTDASVARGTDTDLGAARASATAAFANASIYLSQVGDNSYVYVDANGDQLMDQNDLFIELLGVDATAEGFINFIS